MSYRRRPATDWGVLAATVLAVPLCLAWLVEGVGGALACAGVDAPCGPAALHVALGLGGVAGGAALIGVIVRAAVRRIRRGDT